MGNLYSKRKAKQKHAGFRVNCWCSFCVSKKFNSDPTRKFKAHVEYFIKNTDKEIKNYINNNAIIHTKV